MRASTSLFALPLLLFPLPHSQAGFWDWLLHRETACASVLAPLYLEPDPTRDAPKRQTVFFDRLTPEGTVILVKGEGDPWFASYGFVQGGRVNHGDARAPIAMLGRVLAGAAGFKIVRTDSGSFELHAPGQRNYSAFIQRLNTWLKANGQEPIGVLPIECEELASAIDIIRAASEAEGDFELQFFYADDLPWLTVHEVAYHLGILQPLKLLRRGRRINDHTLRLIDLLQRNSDRLPQAEAIVAQLIAEQTYALDAGHANPTLRLGILRMRNGLRPYREIYPLVKDTPSLQSIVKAIDLLARPQFTPLEASLLRLEAMTDVPLSDLLPDQDPQAHERREYVRYEDEAALSRRTPILSAEDRRLFRQLMADYASQWAELENGLELATPERWTEEFFLGLDARISTLERAAEATFKAP